VEIRKKKMAGNLILFFSLTMCAHGQEQFAAPMQDTSESTLRNLDSEYLFKMSIFSLPLSLQTIPKNTPYFYDQSSILSLQYCSWKLQQNLNLEPIWKLELAKQDKYKTLNAILGSIEAGGVGYLAYLHFKKYGLK